MINLRSYEINYEDGRWTSNLNYWIYGILKGFNDMRNTIDSCDHSLTKRALKIIGLVNTTAEP